MRDFFCFIIGPFYEATYRCLYTDDFNYLLPLSELHVSQ
jgi:hypothetical protein